ncbi:MAG: DUF1415 domain-containing protein [Thalassotalea sp.]
MKLLDENIVIKQTKQWLNDIIIELNFCPFAKKEFINNTIHYFVSDERQIDKTLDLMIKQVEFLVNNPSIETALIIFNQGYSDFEQYLDLLDFSNQLLSDCGYEGQFQIASFHPEYCFEGEAPEDAANFTNRSPYPMLHLLREVSLEKVLAIYPSPEAIPENNIELARSKGSDFFIQALKNIHQLK